jgi:hypothetical protein
VAFEFEERERERERSFVSFVSYFEDEMPPIDLLFARIVVQVEFKITNDGQCDAIAWFDCLAYFSLLSRLITVVLRRVSISFVRHRAMRSASCQCTQCSTIEFVLRIAFGMQKRWFDCDLDEHISLSNAPPKIR